VINSLHIRNFQSHRDTRVEFASGVNVFVGTSDGGKSAVLRALLWLATNRPAGEAFRSTWGGETFVKAELDDEVAVSRIKSKTVNKYSLDLPDGVDNPNTDFKAMGQGVPAEVSAVLGLEPINVQRQMDSAFLLSDDWSPGRVAEYLNEVSGLSAIDTAMSAVNAKARQLNANLAGEESRLAAARAERAKLDYLADLEKALACVETDYAAAARTRDDEQELNAIVVEIADLRDKIAGQPDYRPAESTIKDLLQTLSERDAGELIAGQLRTVVDNVKATAKTMAVVDWITGAGKTVDALIADCEAAVGLDDDANALTVLTTDIRRALADIDALSAVTRAERLLGYTRDQYGEYERLTAENRALETLLRDVRESERSAGRAGEQLTALNKQWEAVAPNVCPLCEGRGTLK